MLLLGTGEDVVGTIALVGGDEVGVVDGRKRDEFLHLRGDLALEIGFEDTSTIHGISQVHVVDVPTTDDEVVRVDHGESVVEGNVNFLASLLIGTELDGGGHDDGSKVVGCLLALARLPGELLAVGDNTGGDSGTVVTTPANKHETDLADLAVDLEVVNGLDGLGGVLAGLGLLDLGGAVGIGRLDSIVGVGNVRGVHNEQLLSIRGWGGAVAGRGSIRVRGHGERLEKIGGERIYWVLGKSEELPAGAERFPPWWGL